METKKQAFVQNVKRHFKKDEKTKKLDYEQNVKNTLNKVKKQKNEITKKT